MAEAKALLPMSTYGTLPKSAIPVSQNALRLIARNAPKRASKFTLFRLEHPEEFGEGDADL